jgi:hypothetical protein
MGLVPGSLRSCGFLFLQLYQQSNEAVGQIQPLARQLPLELAYRPDQFCPFVA